MIPLDNFEKWLPMMDECAKLYLNEKERSEFESISEQHREKYLRDILERPIDNFTVINDIYFRSRWAEVIKMLHNGKDLRLLEIASGDADMIPQVMACIYPNSHYITANMNRILNQSLLDKTKGLPLNIKVIEDDAAYITNHLGKEFVDIIAFQHAVNDVFQAILCVREGVDTIYADWMETLPKMIQILQKETSQGTLQQHVKTPFLRLINTLLNVLKKGGTILMNHYLFQLDIDWGYPADLFDNIIPMTREWIKDISDFEEVFFDGFDTKWWIFLRKK